MCCSLYGVGKRRRAARRNARKLTRGVAVRVAIGELQDATAVSVRVAVAAAVVVGIGAFATPALAEHPPEGTATIYGTIQGNHGKRVRLAWLELPQTIERGNGYEVTHPKVHTLRLSAAGRFSFTVPACPLALRVWGCSGTTFDAWATYNGVRCSEYSDEMNMTTGESNSVEWPNVEVQPNKLEPLTCFTVHKTPYVPPRDRKEETEKTS